MLDHLLPLIYREFEYFDEANKENLGYVIRRRARPVSSGARSRQTPPRPPRRSSLSPSARIEGGVAPRRSVKRRRDAEDEDGAQQPRAKKQQTQTPKTPRRSFKRRREEEDDEAMRPRAKKQHTTETTAQKQEQEAATNPEEEEEEQNQEEVTSAVDAEQETEFVTPVKKLQEPTISAKKVGKQKKTSGKMKRTKTQSKVAAKEKEKEKKKVVKVSKSATPKRIPLQDITHLYVNEHGRSYEYQQRERFVAGLTTSVAIRFF
ncbi:uncharacterized protein IUM83_19269 [Phytophthora cinnamomi]|uniref:uncharacterized protein n=1 Tax=Phytophthora cinnamomi TaxID=4785 RepID=UPI00355A2EB2|nr:hypothetical protein IUM83_19269 [Phytophthora cinnamomi]